MIENGRARIVAEGIYFANGVAIDHEERYLYVAETTKKDILRFRTGGDATLTDREVYGPSIWARWAIRTGSHSMKPVTCG